MTRKIIIAIAVLIAVGVLSFYLFQTIIIYLVVSIIITTILTPIVDYLDKIRIGKFSFPRLLAVPIAFSLLLGLLYLFVSLFIPLFDAQIAYFKNIDQGKTQQVFSVFLNKIDSWMIDKGIREIDSISLSSKIEEAFIEFINKFEFRAIINELLGATGGALAFVLSVCFMTFFFLAQKGLLRSVLFRVIPNSYFELSVTAYFKIKKLLSNYLSGLLIQMISVFTVVSVLLKILGFNYAFTIAVFAAIANLIPYAGPILGITFALLVTLTTGGGLDSSSVLLLILTKLGITFALVQLIDNVLLQPLIFSKSVKAHPLEIFIVIIIGASLAGTIGMIMAIPVYTIVRVVFQEFVNGYKEYKIFKSN